MTFMTDEEWKNKMAQSSMMNAYNQGLGGLGHYKKHPLDGYDIKSIPSDELIMIIEVLTKEYDRRTRHTPLQGPTRAELENNEALKHAWEAFEMVKKLQGK